MNFMQQVPVTGLLLLFALRTEAASLQGRVVDLEGNPVPKGEVRIDYMTQPVYGYLMPWIPTAVAHHFWQRVDDKGDFRVRYFRGYNWHVFGARKAGYEFRDPVERSESNAVSVVRMRKRLNPCFLHHAPYADCHFMQPGGSITWDFIEREKLQVVPPKKRPNWTSPLPRHTADVLIEARLEARNQTWNVVVAAQGSSGGIIAATNTLYEAPAAGYSEKVPFAIPVSRQAKLGANCLIIRSRSPAIVTRLDVKHVVATPEFVRLSFDAYTNPYGDRALDIDPRVEMDYFIRKDLIEESRKAWQAGHPPEKPDFKALLSVVNEFKED